ncbi:MAG: hypothetical protein JW863_20405 [Chitinispirillaceae bacterium]|nr:hypothetical protein [Chitinispirillaceae bacterium]
MSMFSAIGKSAGIIAIAMTVCMAAEVSGEKPADAKATGDTLVVTCRLVEIPGKFVANDVYDYVYIMKYRVLSVEKGTYTGKELLAGHYNPLISRKLVHDKMDPFVDGTVEKYIVGAKHRLTLISPIESVWDGAIEDEYYDTELQKYYALKADLLQ